MVQADAFRLVDSRLFFRAFFHVMRSLRYYT